MNTRTLICAVMALFLWPVLQAHSAQETETTERPFMDWQLKRLFTPSAQQLRAEENGFVFIYDGIKSSDIEKIMKQEFDRIDSMMFTGIIITDEEGNPVIDPKTGLALREDDGC